jgi:hypothetical protein
MTSRRTIEMEEQILAPSESGRQEIIPFVASTHPDFQTVFAQITPWMQFARVISVDGGQGRLFGDRLAGRVGPRTGLARQEANDKVAQQNFI